MQKSFMRAAIIGTLLCAAASAFAAGPPIKVGDTAKGKALVNVTGMTLHTFDKDTGGKSACNGPCADNWPPVMAEKGATASGDYTVITRDDGKSQWAYKGRPLYTWKNDKKAGDITGDGFLNNAWHVAIP